MNPLLYLLRQAASEQNLNDEKEQRDIPAIFVGDRIGEGNLLALTVANDAVEIARRPILDAMQKVAGDPIPNDLRERLVKELNLAAEFYAVEDLRQGQVIHLRVQEVTSEKLQTLMDLYRFETNALNEVHRGFVADMDACLAFVYAGTELFPIPVEWEPNKGLESCKVLAKSIRRCLYPYVQALTGIDLASLSDTEEAARIAREGMFRTYCEHVLPAQAERNRKSYLHYVISGSRYWDHPFLKRVWISNPRCYFNELFCRYAVGRSRLE